LAVVMGRRFLQRQDMPPPAFVLVVMAFASVAAGTVIALLAERMDSSFYWLTLHPLLAYQAFVLLPILGVGKFILPRFLGLPVTGTYPDSRTPPPGWWREAGVAAAVGVLLLGTFFLEAAGWHRTAYAARFALAGGWLITQVPLRPSLAWRNGVVLMMVTGMVLLAGGYLALATFPVWRTALLHIVLGGGFGFITLGVATRVMYGHSGNRDRLQRHTGWLITAGVLMLLGLISRISADFMPRLLLSHYTYGALFWTAGVLLWSALVLPKALVPDPEE
ncbi:MAG TPA: NnrS family protein, partial [Methylomirabilota bacterium]|nr:NnrS family protein [Methylomirabilota bacterium]